MSDSTAEQEVSSTDSNHSIHILKRELESLPARFALWTRSKQLEVVEGLQDQLQRIPVVVPKSRIPERDTAKKLVRCTIAHLQTLVKESDDQESVEVPESVHEWDSEDDVEDVPDRQPSQSPERRDTRVGEIETDDDSDRDEGPLYFGYPPTGVFQGRENTPDDVYRLALLQCEEGLSPARKRKPENIVGCGQGFPQSPLKQSKIVDKMAGLGVD